MHEKFLMIVEKKIACEQAPSGEKKNRQARRAERGMASSIFVFALYPTWEPVHRLRRRRSVYS